MGSMGRGLSVIMLAVLTLPGAAQTVNDEALLREVLTANAAAREKLTAFSMRYSWSSTTPAIAESSDDLAQLVSDRRHNGTATEVWSRRGRYVYLESSSAKSDGSEQQSHRHEAVLNESYFGICDTSPGHVFMCEQYDRPTGAETAANFSGIVSSGFWHDLLRYGFGSGDEYLQTAVLAHPGAIRWHIERESGKGKLYKLTRYTPATFKANQPDTEYWIDGDKGHLITKVRSYAPAGTLWLSIEVAAREAVPGIWVPGEIHEIRDGAQFHATIGEITLISEPAEDQFTWSAFVSGVENAQLARREHHDGTSVTSVFVDRQLVPRN